MEVSYAVSSMIVTVLYVPGVSVGLSGDTISRAPVTRHINNAHNARRASIARNLCASPTLHRHVIIVIV